MSHPSARHGTPSIVGFDPPSGEEPAAAPVVFNALLDIAPTPDWITTYLEESVSLRDKFALDDLRISGRHLHFVGRIIDTRSLVADAQSLAHRVNRILLQRRVLAQPSDAEREGLPLDDSRRRDLAATHAIAALPSMLEAASLATGMRFVAVARVTESRWTACAVYDLIDFGLKPGQDLVLETTLCNEVRQNQACVMFNQASTDPLYASHPTPPMYGFESYISVPIFYRDGSFFGTLCALDPEPARLDDATIETIKAFARLIGMQLESDEAAAVSTLPPTLAHRLDAIARHASMLDIPSLPSHVRDVARRIHELSRLSIAPSHDPA